MLRLVTVEPLKPSQEWEPAGGIYLGSTPAQQFTRGEWAKAVALVSQEPVLFAGGLHTRLAPVLWHVCCSW